MCSSRVMGNREAAATLQRQRGLVLPNATPAQLLGTYNPVISYGQAHVQAVWTRIIFPDGTSINLDGMSGHDDQGKSGFRDQIENHYARLIGFAVLTSAFTAGLELSQRQNATLLAVPSAGQTPRLLLGNNSPNYGQRSLGEI